MRLSSLNIDDEGVIVNIKGRGAFRKRITEMGFVKGQKVKVIKKAPFKGPVEYELMGYSISLRFNESKLIEVISPNEYTPKDSTFEGTIDNDILKTGIKNKTTINIALVGNPNCGKTSLFNFASNSKEHVGNYSGVTVDTKTATFKHNDYKIRITDLPGTYSISAYTPEEIFVRRYIYNEMPDIVVNVVDASNLERNLYLTTQLIDMDIKVVIALNMYDELEKRKANFDHESLSKMIGIPIIPTVGIKGQGINELLNKIIEVHEDKDPVVRHIHVNYGKEIESSVKKIQNLIKKNVDITNKYSSRYIALKFLEKDNKIKDIIAKASNYDSIIRTSDKEVKKIEREFSEDSETVITDTRYGFISGALRETFKKGTIDIRKTTQQIDSILTNKYLGIPIFLFFMWLMFSTTFTLGQYPMEWIENLVSYISSGVSSVLPDGDFKSLLVDGIIGGAGSVLVFLPNIMILFLFISIMEDTGYMSRSVFIVDKFMHKIGLHGSSFIPLIMGFGCNVPAIMATRTIRNQSDRILTILINPLMSCSARLPVYLFIVGTFFPERAGTIIFGIYLAGVLFAILMAKLLKNSVFKKEEAPFVMELPPYRIPTLRNTISHMWSRASMYLKKIASVILIASVIIWILSNYPKTPVQTADSAKTENIVSKQETNNTYIVRIGKTIEPVIKPLGFDWELGISLMSGVVAKEIVISTLSVIYADGDESKLTSSFAKKYNPAVALSFIIFVLVYFPCISVISTIRKETNSWKWAGFVVFYTTSLAWGLSFITYNISKLIF